MLILHTIRYDDWNKELQGFEDGHCFEIVSYKDTDGKEWFKIYFDTQQLAVVGNIGEAESYCRGLSDGLYNKPTGYEINKLIMSLLIADNGEKSARGLCLGHLFQIVYDEDEEGYEEYSIAIDHDIVEDVGSFEEALAYCYGYAEGLDPNKPLYLKKGKGVIQILKE